MTKWVALSGVLLMTCARPCPPTMCASVLRVPLTADERAVFDEGETSAEVCVDMWCATFKVPAGAAESGAGDGSSSLILESTGLRLESFSLGGEASRDVRLTVWRDTTRVTRTWPGIRFSFMMDQSQECAQSCSTASIPAD